MNDTHTQPDNTDQTPEMPEMQTMPQQNTNASSPEHHTDTEPENTSGIGPIAGVAVIIALLILGGWYFWLTHMQQDADNDTGPPVIPADPSDAPDANSTDIQETGSADANDADSLEAELQASDMDEFESQMETDLEELEAAFDAEAEQE